MTREEYIRKIGFKDSKEVKEATGMVIEFLSNNTAYLEYSDDFHRSILSRGSILNHSGLTDKEILKDFEKKVKYKRSKIPRMEGMRNKLIEETTEYISNTFKIDRDLILRSDFKFIKYSKIEIGEATFSFSSTYSKVEIDLNRYCYTYERGLDTFNDLCNYYYKQSLETITKNIESNDK